ncbi:hypothetical protein DFH27DRAFT_524748 [Peziza echinospora]|nr:hypothetical protein DFH27DRAFT_524748 [Peziza echinospora]
MPLGNSLTFLPDMASAFPLHSELTVVSSLGARGYLASTKRATNSRRTTAYSNSRMQTVSTSRKIRNSVSKTSAKISEKELQNVKTHMVESFVPCLKCFNGATYSGPDAEILRNMSMPQIYTDSCKSVGIDPQANSANGRGFQKNSFLGLVVGPAVTFQPCDFAVALDLPEEIPTRTTSFSWYSYFHPPN